MQGKAKSSLSNWKQLAADFFSKGKQESLTLLKDWKNKPATNLIGLDIGSNYIKLLKLKISSNQGTVENFCMESIPPSAVEKGEIKDVTAIANALREIIKHLSLATTNVALAIPRSSTIIKNITVDNRLTADEIESRAWIEANRLFPDLVGDIYLDFTIAGPSAQDASQLDIILVACRKDLINPYLEVLKQVGLQAKIVDVNCFALERALPLVFAPSTDLNTVALLNLDLTLSSLVVVQNETMIYAHDQSFDGQRLVAQINNKMAEKDKVVEEKMVVTTENNTEEAVETKPTETAGQTNFNDIYKELLSTYLRHTMHFFYSSRPNISIQQIILTGDCANLPELAAFIQNEIGAKTLVANPFSNMTLAPAIDKQALIEHAPAMMLCCGLALSEVK